jgi:type IV pilus assembly protein PilP
MKLRDVAVLVLCGGLLAACEDTAVQLGPPPAPTLAAGGAAGGPVAEVAAEPEKITFRDDDFVESERNRDPFRSYSRMFSVKPPETAQRNVAMPNTPIEEMRLIGIVTGTARPRAMLVDPSGVGHVVERGVYIGRPQVVQATENVQMMLHWRVDRIRENEVVLTREDPTDPSRPPLTRVVPLREGEDTSG